MFAPPRLRALDGEIGFGPVSQRGEGRQPVSLPPSAAFKPPEVRSATSSRPCSATRHSSDCRCRWRREAPDGWHRCPLMGGGLVRSRLNWERGGGPVWVTPLAPVGTGQNPAPPRLRRRRRSRSGLVPPPRSQSGQSQAACPEDRRPSRNFGIDRESLGPPDGPWDLNQPPPLQCLRRESRDWPPELP